MIKLAYNPHETKNQCVGYSKLSLLAVSRAKRGFIMPVTKKPQKVQIPLELFNKIIAFMKYCDISDCEPNLQKLYRDVFSGLITKQESIELRDAYAKIVTADGEEQRKQARIAYLEQKELNKL